MAKLLHHACSEEAVSCGWRAGKDDGEGVPGRPVCCVAVGVGATQAEPAEPFGVVGRPGDSTGSKLKQAGEALGDARVMGNRVVLGDKVSRLAALNQVLQHLVPAWGDWRPLAWVTIALTARRSKPISCVVGWPGGICFRHGSLFATRSLHKDTKTRNRSGTCAGVGRCSIVRCGLIVPKKQAPYDASCHPTQGTSPSARFRRELVDDVRLQHHQDTVPLNAIEG